MIECQRRIARGGWNEDKVLGRCRFPVGPRNTISNVAYVVTGLLAVHYRPGALSDVFAVAMFALGVGSALYHGLKTKWANNFDWLGMYAVAVVLLLYVLVGDSPGVSGAALVMAGITGAGMAFFLERRFDLVMGVTTVLCALVSAYFGNALLAVAGVAAFVAGYGCWLLDKAGKIRLWGHALWHVLTAAGLLLVFLAR